MERSLAAIGSAGEAKKVLQQIADPEVQHSLLNLKSDSRAIEPATITVGTPPCKAREGWHMALTGIDLLDDTNPLASK